MEIKTYIRFFALIAGCLMMASACKKNSSDIDAVNKPVVKLTGINANPTLMKAFLNGRMASLSATLLSV